jgi:hypothetical protein
MSESDALSEVLRGLRLTGAIFLRAEMSEPWGFRAPAAGEAAALLAPGTELLVPFHLVTDGAATVRVKGCEPVRLEPGEIVVLPRGDTHVLENGAAALSLPKSPSAGPGVCRLPRSRVIVPMVEASHLRELDYLPQLGPLDSPEVRRIAASDRWQRVPL